MAFCRIFLVKFAGNFFIQLKFYKMLFYKYLNKIKIITSLILMFCLSEVGLLSAQQTEPQPISINNTQLVDSQKVKTEKKDSVDISKKTNPNAIDSEVAYQASDSIVFLGNGTGFLYGNSDMTYKKINLKADFVRVKMDSSMIYACGTPDSLGVLVGNPVFSEAEQEPYSAKELTYNLKSKKGYIRQAVTQQGEGYILSDKAKKTESDEVCMSDGKYTTCEDHDHPHFYLSLSKAKVKPGSYVATGPAHMVLLDIPLPAVIPFGYFPFNSKYSSGVQMPTFEDEATYGFGLTNGGYYFAISDYMDLDIKGDIYTRGTWAVNVNSNYLRRYKYNGNLSFTYRETVTGDPDIPSTYSKAKNMSIRWSHSQNPKVNPFRTLSASVNFSTSGYNRNNVNSLYSPIVAENTKSSSVSFSQRFPNNPFSITGSMQVDQRTKDSTMNLTLPSLSISMSRIYPFKRKNAVGNERWYEKIAMSYSGSLSNGIYNIKEDQLLKSSITRDWKNGMQHNIPISASFNLFKYINFSANANYNERWSLSSVKKSYAWNETTMRGKEVVDTIYGFNRNYNFNFGVSASTILYGFYTPMKAIFGSKIEKIRHVMTPSFGLGYYPDFSDSFWGFYDSYTKKTYNTQTHQVVNSMVRYSKFEGTMFGGPSAGKSGSINFSLKNNLEMKVKNPKDTTNANATKIISLIDNFTINGNYNLMADSMNLSTLNTTLGLKWKWFTYSFNLVFDPYMWGLKSDGKTPVKINKLRWNNGRFPRFMGISIPFSYTINNDTFKKKNKKEGNSDENGNVNGENGDFKDENVNDVLNERDQTQSADQSKVEKDKDGYEKISVPWSISMSYSVSYGDDVQTANYGGFDYNKMEYKRKIWGSVLNLSGNIQLTKGWQVTATSGYDFNYKQLTYTSFNVTRNLHCWTLTGSFVPVGPVKTYSFRIGVNASMLQDLKYEKQGGRSYGQNNVIWY